MKKIEGPIKTELLAGDSYVDEPVLNDVPVFCGKEPMTTRQLSHYRRVPLRWVKPGRATVNNCTANMEQP